MRVPHAQLILLHFAVLTQKGTAFFPKSLLCLAGFCVVVCSLHAKLRDFSGGVFF